MPRVGKAIDHSSRPRLRHFSRNKFARAHSSATFTKFSARGSLALYGEEEARPSRYRDGGLWSPTYFAASAGGAQLAIIKQYVEQQAMSGRFLQSIRLDVPLKALTSTDTDSLGGDHDVRVISLPVAGQQPTIHLGEDLPSVPRQPLKCRCSEYLVPVFGGADQMNDKYGNAVYFAPIALHSVGRPSRWNE